MWYDAWSDDKEAAAAAAATHTTTTINTTATIIAIALNQTTNEAYNELNRLLNVIYII